MSLILFISANRNLLVFAVNLLVRFEHAFAPPSRTLFRYLPSFVIASAIPISIITLSPTIGLFSVERGSFSSV